jgi:hypothetical protein
MNNNNNNNNNNNKDNNNDNNNNKLGSLSNYCLEGQDGMFYVTLKPFLDPPKLLSRGYWE